MSGVELGRVKVTTERDIIRSVVSLPASVVDLQEATVPAVPAVPSVPVVLVALPEVATLHAHVSFLRMKQAWVPVAAECMWAICHGSASGKT